MYQDLIEKKKKLAVIGLGYVGLPIALEFARKVKVIGFDINASRVAMMRNGIDPSQELEKEAFDGCDIEFTHDLEVLKQANFFIVAVPTPVDEHNTWSEPAVETTRLSTVILTVSVVVQFPFTTVHTKPYTPAFNPVTVVAAKEESAIVPPLSDVHVPVPVEGTTAVRFTVCPWQN